MRPATRRRSHSFQRSVTTVIEHLENRRLLSAVLTKDLNTLTLDSGPTNVTNVNGTAFFTATTPQLGTELYKSDGTAAGTTLVKDIYAGVNSASPGNLTALGSSLIFTAYDPTNGNSLWKSDGTAAGTTVLRKGANAQFLTVVGTNVFFYGYDAGTSQYGLMKTDGTSANTKLVKGSISVSGKMAAVGSTLFFSGYNNTGTQYGQELYKSDGSSGGTVIVKDIYAGTNGSYPQKLTAVGTKLFFVASDAFGDYELYKSDGTAGGTARVKDINTVSSSSPNNLTAVGNTLFFTASDNPATNSLWKSDGSSAGTVVVKPTIYPSNLIASNGKLFFQGYDTANSTYELYKSDGTNGGTVRVENANSGSYSPSQLTNVNNVVYFTAYKQGVGTDGLYKSDGTAGGTVLVKDLNTAGYDSINYITAVGSKAFFSAAVPAYGAELWVSDGTAAGTHLTADLNTNTQALSVTKTVGTSDGRYYFFAYDPVASTYNLYRSDGTAAGTLLLKTKVSTSELTAVGTKVYFVATGTAAPNYQELWVTDGSVAGTKQVDSSTGGSYAPSALVAGSGVVYFNAYQYSGGAYGLWKSDGTSGGTTLLKSGLSIYSSSGKYAALIGSTLYFSGYSNAGTQYGYELYKTNGTAAGTTLVKDLYVGNGSSTPNELTAVGSTLYFAAYDAFGDYELYKSDGSSGGTVLVKNINASASSSPNNLTAVGTTLYFLANDGTGNGNELWKSNSAGTSKIRAKLSAQYLANLNGTLYFFGSDAAAGNYSKLFKSDGTSGGTSVISPSTLGGVNSPLVAVQNRLFFAGYDSAGSYGYELWETDGTSGGTKRVKDIYPGAYSSSPGNLRAAGNNLYLTADDGTHGTEVWTVQAPKANAGGSYTVAEGGTVALSSAASTDLDPSETPTYKWDLDGDGIFGETGVNAKNGNETGVAPTFNSAGLAVTSKTISLQVTNGVGLFSTVVTSTVKLLPKAASSLAFSVANHQVKLTWHDNSSIESGFKVLRSTDGVTYSSLKTVASNILTYTDTTTTAGKKYYYKIVATDSNGDGAASNIVTMTA